MPKKKIKKENKEKEIEEIPDFTEDYGEIFATWEFPEHEKPERSKKWYIFFFLTIILLIIVSLFNFTITLFNIGGQPFTLSFIQNIPFVIILILFIIVYFHIENQNIKNIQVSITEDGILINDKLLEYKNIDHFYIIYHPPIIKKLYIQPRNMLQHRITIPLEDINPVELREVLLMYIEEDLEKEEEPTTESLTKILRL